jgi:hypothetical protein
MFLNVGAHQHKVGEGDRAREDLDVAHDSAAELFDGAHRARQKLRPVLTRRLSGLKRSSRGHRYVHERQVDVLTKLHRHLWEAHGYLQHTALGQN